MSRGFIVDDIVNEVRSLVDEYNENQLSTVNDILPSLNRAQEKAVKILTRAYPDPILQYIEITQPRTREIDIPENVWADKLIRLEWFTPQVSTGQPRECQKVTIRLLSQHSQDVSQADNPDCYATYGRNIRFSATPSGKMSLRIWFIREIDYLVQSFGRITDLDENTGTLYLGEVPSTFDPFSTIVQGDWNSYINVVDGQTGIVKGSFQIKSWDDVDTLTIKTVPDRSLVVNRTINTSLSNLEIAADDYICHIKGTSVLYFFDEVHSFIVQHAVAECKRKLGYAYDADQTLLKEFETELKKTYAGRSLNMRIVQNNPNWMKGSRRRFYRGYKL